MNAVFCIEAHLRRGDETTRVMKPDRETANCVTQYYERLFD